MVTDTKEGMSGDSYQIQEIKELLYDTNNPLKNMNKNRTNSIWRKTYE